MLGQADRLRIRCFCRERECSVEAYGGLLPRGVSSVSKKLESSFDKLTEVIEVIKQLAFVGQRDPRTSRAFF